MALKEIKYLEQHDLLVHGVAADETVRCLAAVTTNLVDEACQRHRAVPTAAAALGRTLTGALLIGNGMKDLEKVTIRFRCDGIMEGITAEADAFGNVRGYVRNPEAHVPPKPNGKLDVSGAIGQGMMYVIREAGFDIGFRPDPYVGSVPIISGEIAEDFAYYLNKSEQIPSAVGLGVYLEPDPYRVAAAGGFIIQLLPGADPDTITRIEESIRNSPPLTELIHSGLGPEQILIRIMGEMDLKLLDEKKVRFHCHCSRERAVNIITCLGRDEVMDMLEKDKGAELICHFCEEVYTLDEDTLHEILGSFEQVS